MIAYNYQISFKISISDTTLLQKHRKTFETIYNSLSGNDESTRSIQQVLRKILNINVPLTYNLEQNYPNPFNPKTKIRFNIPQQEIVTLKVYNILGQVVNIPVKKKMYDMGRRKLYKSKTIWVITALLSLPFNLSMT